VQVCIKEYQTLPFFDGKFATVLANGTVSFSFYSPKEKKECFHQKSRTLSLSEPQPLYSCTCTFPNKVVD
jgi:hypothetical protein